MFFLKVRAPHRAVGAAVDVQPRNARGCANAKPRDVTRLLDEADSPRLGAKRSSETMPWGDNPPWKLGILPQTPGGGMRGTPRAISPTLAARWRPARAFVVAWRAMLNRTKTGELTGFGGRGSLSSPDHSRPMRGRQNSQAPTSNTDHCFAPDRQSITRQNV